MTFKKHIPAQNMDVHYYQTRIPREWKARVQFNGETFVFGPANMFNLTRSVNALLSAEAKYADAIVHEEVLSE